MRKCKYREENTQEMTTIKKGQSLTFKFAVLAKLGLEPENGKPKPKMEAPVFFKPKNGNSPLSGCQRPSEPLLSWRTPPQTDRPPAEPARFFCQCAALFQVVPDQTGLDWTRPAPAVPPQASHQQVAPPVFASPPDQKRSQSVQ